MERHSVDINVYLVALFEIKKPLEIYSYDSVTGKQIFKSFSKTKDCSIEKNY
jgi:hypothetical protein